MAALWQKNDSSLRLPVGSGVRARTLLQRTARLSGHSFREVGIIYVTTQVSRSLNRRYRKHDWVTDVLSFTYQAKPVVGELVICLQQAQAQAKRAHHSLSAELALLWVHGYLHLAGYDHVHSAPERKVMRSLEDRILKR